MASSSGVVYIRPSEERADGHISFHEESGRVVIRGKRGSDEREPAQPAVRVAIKLS